jgi:anti-sigma-K factor RskA
VSDETTDRFQHDDAPYVLGLLGTEERRRFEAHLTGCADCRASVDQLTGTAALLAELDVGDVDAVSAGPEPVPDTTLAIILRRVQAKRRRRLGVLAGIAAACLAAIAVTLSPAVTGPADTAHPMAAVSSTPLTATATLTTDDNGTRITLACHYAKSAGYPVTAGTYLLTVVDTSGTTHDLGSWTIRPGADTRFSSGVALPRSQIRRVLVTNTQHRAVLTLTL